MAKFGIYFNAFATTTGAKTALSFYPNGAGERAEVIELIMTGSGSAAAADRQHRAQAAKCTFGSTGTGSVATPEPFSEIANAARIQTIIEHSAEPTTVGSVFPLLWGFNQRGGMRWAVPQGEGFQIHNADTENGMVFQVLSDAAGEVDGSGHLWEP